MLRQNLRRSEDNLANCLGQRRISGRNDVCTETSRNYLLEIDKD